MSEKKQKVEIIISFDKDTFNDKIFPSLKDKANEEFVKDLDFSKMTDKKKLFKRTIKSLMRKIVLNNVMSKKIKEAQDETQSIEDE